MARRESLSNLLGPGQASVATTSNDAPVAVLLPVARCAPNPHNPRRDLGDLADLADIVGIQLQSVLAVTRGAYLGLWPEEADALRGVDHIIVNGCRRHAASLKYGRSELIAVVNDDVASSRARLLRAAFDENDKRLGFDPIEEAEAVSAIVGEYPSQAEACRAEGWDKTWASQRLRLLLLAPAVQESVRARAAGQDGLAIREARWLSGRPGIAEMTEEQQFAAVLEMRVEEQQKKAVAKAERQASKVPAAKAKPVKSNTAVYDITEAPPAADALASSEAAYTAVFDASESSSEPAVSGGEASVEEAGLIPDQREGGPAVELGRAGQLVGAQPEQIAQMLVDQVPADDLMEVIDLVIAQLRSQGKGKRKASSVPVSDPRTRI
jgi:hypothetical protein